MEWVEGDKVDRLAGRFANGDLDYTRLMQTLTEIYLRMLLVEGFMHADPHPGNIQVQADGTIVLLDWGMAVQLTRQPRESLLRLSHAAGRDDLDAMISGMYELGMIDPGISRSEIREAAAEILAIVARVRELGVRRAQEMIRDIMDTFYTWPLMLPRELVYFFRAAALLEGIGFRYDPAFNGLEAVRPVVLRMKTTLLQATAREPREFARSLVDDARASLLAVRQLITRAEREEFRVRIHPRDLLRRSASPRSRSVASCSASSPSPSRSSRPSRSSPSAVSGCSPPDSASPSSCSWWSSSCPRTCSRTRCATRAASAAATGATRLAIDPN
jgi:predicted unusual protein kinase regulating ubiquinone biosynthesis (AarF/ABC1/UbiB family)